jgi:hypothetical protein
MDLTAFSKWLGATEASLAIQNAAWVIPAVQSVHILCIAIVMSSAGLLNLRVAGLIGRHQPVRALAHSFLPWIWWTLPVLLTTGLILILGEPGRELLNRFFWYKMTALLIVVLLTIPLHRMLEDTPLRDLPLAKRETVRTIALISLAIWLFIVFCGRWIAYA